MQSKTKPMQQTPENSYAAAARARIKSILTHENAKGREAVAEKIAFDTTLSVEEAAVVLAAAPKSVGGKPAAGQPLTIAERPETPLEIGAGDYTLGAKAAAQGEAKSGWGEAFKQTPAKS